jgi:AraC-like DNA-binding protein
MTLLRSACLTDFPEIARSVGLQPEALLSAVGIDRRALGDPDFRIPVQAFRQLLEEAVRQSGVENFGLRLAETRQLSILGPIGLLIREEPTVRHALRSLARYMALHNEALDLRLDEVDGQAIASLESTLVGRVSNRQGLELSVGVLFRILTTMVSAQWQPIVCFTYASPARRDVHRRLFGPRVDFLCNFNGIIFAAEELDRPVPDADPRFAEHARRYLDSLMANSEPTLQAKVRELVRLQLASGRCTADRLANQVGCDRRTLHRRLARENVTFDSVLNSVRSNLAVSVLQNRGANLASAADLLGFSSTSAFSRWFLGTFGQRPSEWRKDPGRAATSSSASAEA